MEPVEEYLVIYSKENGCESCDCPGYTMHLSKKGVTQDKKAEHKHFQVVHQWIKRGRPIFEAYVINTSGIVAIPLVPQM